ncbi:hypothetical protein AGMMS50239_37290 [Bacteroidia bacterium]|nr:hypothetical protein AGMMS50239_37290 [Bacteroidia bacterium]
MIKYYEMIGSDNNSEFYYMNDNVLEYCPCCGLIKNREEAINNSIKDFRLKNRKNNFSVCTDGPAIVSEKFVKIVKNYNLNGFSFTILPNSEGFYLLRSTDSLGYDYEYNTKLYLRNKCNCCGQWEEISKILPIKIIDEDEIKMTINTFYETNLQYGGRVLRTPIRIVTNEVPFYFKKENIKDISFRVCGRDWIPGDYRKNVY